MSAPERNPDEWEFRLLGRVLFRLPHRVIYLIILGLSIGVGLKSPGAALNLAEATVQKLLQELHDWRMLVGSFTKRSSSAGKKKRAHFSPAAPSGGTGYSSDELPASQGWPDTGEAAVRRRRFTTAVCYADADRLQGRPLRLREAPCSTSQQRRSVPAGTGGIRLTGRYADCMKYGVWWTWSEVVYENELLWAARHYLRCLR